MSIDDRQAAIKEADDIITSQTNDAIHRAIEVLIRGGVAEGSARRFVAERLKDISATT